ncbi:hypothetical protein ACN47E_001662 [Coniothyrium glycines]
MTSPSKEIHSTNSSGHQMEILSLQATHDDAHGRHHADCGPATSPLSPVVETSDTNHGSAEAPQALVPLSVTAHGIQSYAPSHVSTPSSPSYSPNSTLVASSTTFENFPDRCPEAAAARSKFHASAQIFGNTRDMMGFHGTNMSIFATRGFPRSGYLPSKKTTPPLLARRYSIEVLTKRPDRATWREQELAYATRYLMSHHNETDLVICRRPLMLVPTPMRYASLSDRLPIVPPGDEKTYLDLGDVQLSNVAFRYISCVNVQDFGVEVWMTGDSISMALEVLRRDLDCDNHSIAIVNGDSAQILRMAFAYGDACGSEYDYYRQQYHGKRWIFIVINDGYSDTTSNGTHGSHWSLVGIDVCGEKVHYYDSISVRNSARHENAQQVAAGMVLILGLELAKYQFYMEYHSPDQYANNMFAGDGGPCGPFIYLMTMILCRKIIDHQAMGRENDCWLDLDHTFPAFFTQHFHSLHVRYYIQRSIARWKTITQAPLIAQQYDYKIACESGVELLPHTADNFCIPKPPVYSWFGDWGLGHKKGNFAHRSPSLGRDQNDTDVMLMDATEVEAGSDAADEIYVDTADEDGGNSIMRDDAEEDVPDDTGDSMRDDDDENVPDDTGNSMRDDAGENALDDTGNSIMRDDGDGDLPDDTEVMASEDSVTQLILDVAGDGLSRESNGVGLDVIFSVLMEEQDKDEDGDTTMQE